MRLGSWEEKEGRVVVSLGEGGLVGRIVAGGHREGFLDGGGEDVDRSLGCGD